MGIATRLAVAHLERIGLDPTSLLARAGLSRSDLASDKRVNADLQIDFLEQVSRAARDDWIGFTLAATVDLREAGMLYYAAASSHRLGDALARLQRYCSVGNEALVVRLDRGTLYRVCVSYSGVARHRDRHFIEFLSLVLLRLSRHIVGRELTPRGVNFIHHRADELRKAQRILGCEVQFGAYTDEICFDAAVMDLPVVSHDPFLNELMVKMCEDALALRAGTISPFRTAVENAIAPLLPHAEADGKRVAGKLGLSERTFARRLAGEGLSFGSILDDLRRDLAERYLAEGLQVSRIAWLLGFHHPSSFTHACRRWTGKSPSQRRREIRSAQG